MKLFNIFNKETYVALLCLVCIYGLATVSLTRMQRNLPLEFHPTADDGYYLLYAHNLVFDGTMKQKGNLYQTSRPAKAANSYGVGASLLWLGPALMIRSIAPGLPTCIGGDCPEVFSWFGGIGGSLALGGLILLYFAGRRWFSQVVCVLSAVSITFSTIVPYYLFFRPMMAHGSEFFLFSAILCMLAWARVGRKQKWIDLFFGFLLGALCVTRFQDIVWIPSLILIWHIRQFGPKLRVGRDTLMLFIGFLIGIFPQLLFFMVQRGAIPTSLNSLYHSGASNLETISLFSFYPGWMIRIKEIFWGPGFGYFSLTPVTILGIVGGLFWLISKFKRQRLFSLIIFLSVLVPFFMFILLSSNTITMSYGNRLMLINYLIIMPGLGFLLSYFLTHNKKWVKWAGLVLFFVCFWIGAGGYLLFHTNQDTLTLRPHPVFMLGRYYPEGLLSNPTYDRNALSVLIKKPHRPFLSIGASVMGYAVYKGLKSTSLWVNWKAKGPIRQFIEYHERHPVRMSLVGFYLLGFVFGGTYYALLTFFIIFLTLFGFYYHRDENKIRL